MGRPPKPQPPIKKLTKSEEVRLQPVLRQHRSFLWAICDTPPGKRKAVISDVDPLLLDFLAYLLHLVLKGVIPICREDIAFLRKHRAEKRAREQLESERDYQCFVSLSPDAKRTTLLNLGLAPNVLLRPLFYLFPKRSKKGEAAGE
jgi:hypothetical protein